MFQCCDMKFSEMNGKDIVDSTGEKIGRVIDFAFDYVDEQIRLTSVVMGGSRIEEFLESIGVKEDDDPFFQLGCIDRFEEDKLHLAVECSNLDGTYSADGLAKNEMRLSNLAKLPVIDSDGMEVGKIEDVWFDADNRIWLIVGGGIFGEILGKLRISADFDLLVPPEFVTSVSQKEIRLKYTKFQLESTCEEEYQKYKREISSRHKPKDAKHTLLKLGRARTSTA